MKKLCNLHSIIMMLFSYTYFYIDNSPVITSEVIDKIRSLPTTSANDTKPPSVETVTESTSDACPQSTQLMNVQSSKINSVKGLVHTLWIFIILI